MAVVTGYIYAVSFRALWKAQRIVFTHIYRVTDPGTALGEIGATQDVVEHFADTVAGSTMGLDWLNCISTDVDDVKVRAQILGPTGRYSYVEDVVQFTPLDPDVAETGNVCTTLTFVPVVAVPRRISVKKIGPIRQADMEDGAPTANLKSRLNALAEIAAAPITTMGLGQQLSPVIYRASDGDFRTIQSWRIPDRLTTLRRRTLRVGE